jgi:putative nucleotidyltransferase with HDIG domain
MAHSPLENEIGSILAGERESLAVARARCYAMGPTGEYRLSGAFGFGARFGPEDFLDPSHPLVDWVQHHRRAAYANAPSDALRMAATMEREQYARMLAAPIYVGSRLVGILELQDKLSGAFFTSDDLRQAEIVAQRIGGVLDSYGGTSVGGPEPIPQEDADALFRPGGYEGELHGTGELPPPPPLFTSRPSPAAEAAPPPPPARTPPLPTRREELVFRGFWTTLLLVPEIEAVAFSSWSRESAEIQIGTRRPFSDAARATLLANLETALSNAMPGVRLPSDRRFTTEYPLGRTPGEIPSFGGIQTSVLSSGTRVRLLTLLFTRPPEAAAAEALKETHRLVRTAVLQSVSGERYRQSFRSLVKAFIEPGLRTYPQLKAHSFAVGALCRKFATSLRLPADVIEQLTVAGLLHDIGIREVEVPYERLSGRRPLDLQEVALVRRHAPMGADILERIDFPYPVAPLVRHHHERYDGAGYPDGLSGDRIPFGARMIAIAEAFDAMTAPHSYRATVPRDAALETLSLKSGTQFDPDLARLFNELIRATPDTTAGSEGRP